MLLNYRNLKRRNGINNYAFHAFIILGCMYGVYQLFADSALLTLYKLHKTVKQQQQENHLLAQRQKYLETKIKRLEPGENFDYDYLDEIVRDKLGVVKESEKVIYVDVSAN